MTPAIESVFMGLFAVLTLATVVGWWLGRKRPSRASENLKARIYSWWVMILVGGLAMLLGHYGVVLLFAGLAWFALKEYSSSDPKGEPGALYFAAVPVQFVLVAFGQEWAALLLIPIAGFVYGRERWLGLLLCVYCLSFIPAYGKAESMLFFVLVVQASDVLQYIWGNLIGRHPIAPRISPSKTIEGLAGGMANATALGVWLHDLTPFGIMGAVWVGLIITFVGFLSGLVFSAIKRERKLKDWGRAIAGHGGVLDRVDSLCLPAPLFCWLLQRYS
ncbi:MAG: phosphatidate cytidylyltransferase [Acidobacteria bacterium]|nr:phosphatidate cytidylyltransferase [Acidobacteriota bacterium]